MILTTSPSISRRHFLASTGIAIGAMAIAPRFLFGQEGGIVNFARAGAAKADITVQPLRRNISALMGSGGNIAVLPGSDGKLLVDAGFIPSRPKISDALSKISADPLKHLINTHWHFDHTDGNDWLHSEGATIIAHENTRKHLSESTHVEGWNFTFPPAPAGAIPTEVVKDSRKLHLNGTTIALEYYGPCHTDSDISVHFEEADVFHTGDTLWNGAYPFIDYSTGGSIDDKTIVIPGHGPVGDKSKLIEFRDTISIIRDKVVALKKQGKSAEEVVAAKPTAQWDATRGGLFISGEFLTRLVYQGV
jgi:glyoxylase-like metal-dependent hydrolase (beta-lactamase superfamily II)